ncbi:exosome complex exonuclease Rrp41 [Candidatus Pacearchaeota archaeon]|nr:exosome complex exonuclease Rrp41 [Candidatus Pacearchaeota archaeon]
MSYTKRVDGREFDELRKITAKVGVIPRADGSAIFAFGDSIAIAAVYGPRTLHPQHMQNPETGILRCNYDMLSFSVTERKKPGPSRRSSEISKITEWALSPVLQLESFPNTVVDVFVTIIQANASTRCAGINAAALALAHAGVPMIDMVSSVSVGKIGDKICVDLIKEEEDYEGEGGATDIPFAFLPRTGKVSLMQLDGKISVEDLKKALKAGEEACKKIYLEQKKILKALKE